MNFNPRSPWGERQNGARTAPIEEDFNPRSPWGERQQHGAADGVLLPFQSTLPVGGATLTWMVGVSNGAISIHAPRGGSDISPLMPSAAASTISIHAPRGGSDFLYPAPAPF